MRIEKTALDAQNRCVYSLYKEKGCIGHAVTCADCFEVLEMDDRRLLKIKVTVESPETSDEV